MNSPSPSSNYTSQKNSKLLPIGIVLIVIGLFIPSQLDNLTKSMAHSLLWTVLLISTDLFRLCFFAGIGCCIIGAIRNHKSNQHAARSGPDSTVTSRSTDFSSVGPNK